MVDRDNPFSEMTEEQLEEMWEEEQKQEDKEEEESIAKAEAVLHMNTLSSLALSEATTSGEKQVKLSATKECLVLAGVYSQFEASPISIGNMLVQLTQTNNTYLPSGIEPIENRSRVADTRL